VIRFVSCVSVKSCITRDSVKIFGSCRNTWTAKTSMHSILSLIKIRIADVSAHKKAGGVMRITLPDFLFERAFTFFGKFCIMKNGSCTTGCGSVWLECTAGGREVAGSNPVTPIDHKLDTLASVFFCSILKKAIIGWRNIPASAIIGRRGKQGRQGEVR
jgi:hypothetical protein